MVAACTLLALLFSSQALIYYANAGNRISSWRIIVPALVDWYLWAALTPLIVRIARRWPLVSARSLAVHVPASVAIAVLKLAMRAGIGRLARPLQTMGLGSLLLGQLHLNLIAYWVIAGLTHAFDYYRKYRDRELRASQLEARLAQAQLEALRVQLHPHFLFNTLHAISALVRKDPDGAERTIAELSDLLRMTLDNVGRETLPVKDELEFVDRYLSIQQTRFGSRLRVRRDVDARALDALVPTQILQPLVENAIWHGIAPRASGGAIAIAVKRRNGWLTLQVRDDGPGLPAGGASAVSYGVGLTNTRARLHELYGAEASLRLTNADGGGLIAEITLPA